MRLTKKYPKNSSQSVQNMQSGILSPKPPENRSQGQTEGNNVKIAENFKKLTAKIQEIEERIKKLENLRTLLVKEKGEEAVELHESMSGEKEDDIPIVDLPI